MVKAVWNGKIIAQSDDTVVVEGNHYFPLESVKPEYLVTERHSVSLEGYRLLLLAERGRSDECRCHFRFYPAPKDAAAGIKRPCRLLAGRAGWLNAVCGPCPTVSTKEKRMELGFVGLGRMGGNSMVRRLSKAGHHCHIYASSAETREELALFYLRIEDFLMLHFLNYF